MSECRGFQPKLKVEYNRLSSISSCAPLRKMQQTFQSIQSVSNIQDKDMLNIISIVVIPNLASYFGCVTLGDLRYCTLCLDGEVPGLSLKRTENPSIHGKLTLP